MREAVCKAISTLSPSPAHIFRITNAVTLSTCEHFEGFHSRGEERGLGERPVVFKTPEVRETQEQFSRTGGEASFNIRRKVNLLGE